MLDNLHISEQEAETVVEPVTLEEAKDHLQIDLDVTDHDAKILRGITAARQTIEKYTSTSLVEKTVVVSGSVMNGGITELPHGPVRAVTSVVGLNEGEYEHLGVVPDVAPLTGYWRYKWLYSAPVTVTYTAGYEAGKVPEALKDAILTELDYRFYNRGSNGIEANSNHRGISLDAQALAHPYIRMFL